MALSTGSGGGRRGRRRGRRNGALSEINVTPMVDVMLVLLIIFMISAPLLTAGVEVNLPKTEAQSLQQDQSEPLTVSIQTDGSIYVMEDLATYDQVAPRLLAMANNDTQAPIYVRADGRAPYEAVARVMAKLATSGFTRINLITESAPSTPQTSARSEAGE